MNVLPIPVLIQVLVPKDAVLYSVTDFDGVIVDQMVSQLLESANWGHQLVM